MAKEKKRTTNHFTQLRDETENGAKIWRGQFTHELGLMVVSIIMKDGTHVKESVKGSTGIITKTSEDQ